MIRLIAIILACVFSTSAFCKDLKPLMDQYYYQVSVVWDRQDETALKKINQDFRQKLTAQNITEQDVISYVKANTHNFELAAEIQEKLEAIKVGAKTAETAEFEMEYYVTQFYSRGTQWSPTKVVAVSAGFAVVILLCSYAFGQAMEDLKEDLHSQNEAQNNNADSCLLGLGC